MRFAGFRTITRSTTPPSVVSTGPGLVAALRPSLRAIDVSPGVRLLGVSTSNFGASSEQLSLLDGTDEPDRTADAIDEIRGRFGSSAIGPASSITPGGLRVVRTGAQQWGPDDPRGAVGGAGTSGESGGAR